MKQGLSILFVVLWLVCPFMTNAQLYEVSLDQRLQNATTIIEGKVIRKTAFKSDDGHIYTANTIQAFSTLKGGIHSNEIVIITYGGVLEHETETWTHLLSLSKGETGIFFLKPTKRPKSSIVGNVNVAYEVYASSQGFLKYVENEDKTMVAVAPFNHYLKNDILHNIRKVTGQYNMLYTKNEDDLEDVSGVIYSIENITLSNTGLDFDIYIKGLRGIYDLTKSKLLVKYDSNVLGSNIYMNGAVTITKSQVLTASAYQMIISDTKPNELSIDIEAGNENLYTITNLKEQLIHVQIASFTVGNPKIVLEQTNMQQLSEFLTTDNTIEPFQQVFTKGSVEKMGGNFSLMPTIQSFYPTTISSGTGDVLTILGTGFGATRNASFVEFMDSRKGPWVDNVIPLDGEYIKWTDSEIKVIVPNLPVPYGSVGSGKFKVWIDSVNNIVATSPSSLQVPFAAANITTDSIDIPQNKSLPIYLSNNNGLGGETIYYGHNFKSNTGAVEAFERALIKWKCTTYINLTVEDSLDIDDIALANRVEFDLLPAGVNTTIGTANHLANAGSNILNCTDVDTILSGNRISFIIKFNNSTATLWHTDISMPTTLPTDTYDMESAALHEIGHIHLLRHSNNWGDLMYFTNNTPPYRRSIKSNDAMGGNYIMSLSQFSPHISCNDPMIALNPTNCNTATNTTIRKKNSSPLNLYPNPASNLLYINTTFLDKHNISGREDVEVQIFDVLGRNVNFSSPTKGNINPINISFLPKGVYVLNIMIGEEVFFAKFIKQ